MDLYKAVCENNIECVYEFIMTHGLEKERNLLIWAARVGNFDMCCVLLDYDKDHTYVNVQEKETKSTALHAAIQASSNLEVCKLLVRRGASLTLQDTNGDTPFFKACQLGNLDIVKFIWKYIEETCLGNDEVKAKKKLINTRNDKLESPISASLENLHYYVTDFLLKQKHGANPNDWVLVSGKRITLMYWMASKNLVMNVILLLLSKAFVDYADADTNGNTPMHIAAKNGFSHMCYVLLNHGANVNATNYDGNSVLAEAMASDSSNQRTIDILIERGAVNITRFQTKSRVSKETDDAKKTKDSYQMVETDIESDFDDVVCL